MKKHKSERFIKMKNDKSTFSAQEVGDKSFDSLQCLFPSMSIIGQSCNGPPIAVCTRGFREFQAVKQLTAHPCSPLKGPSKSWAQRKPL